MNKSAPLFLAILLTINAQASTSNALNLKKPGTLGVCSYTEFKPISYGNGKGYEADLAKAIAYTLNVKIKFYPQDNYEGIWLAPNKAYSRCDISIGGMTPDHYRIKAGSVFAAPTIHFNQSLLIRRADYDAGRIVSFNSFKNSHLKIGVVPGTTGELYAHKRAKANGIPLSVFIQYQSESALLTALEMGKIDAIARGEIGNDYQANKNKKLKVIARKSFNEAFAFSVDNQNKLLLTKLNETILQLTNNEKINYKQWMVRHNIFMDRAVSIKKTASNKG